MKIISVVQSCSTALRRPRSAAAVRALCAGLMLGAAGCMSGVLDEPAGDDRPIAGPVAPAAAPAQDSTPTQPVAQPPAPAAQASPPQHTPGPEAPQPEPADSRLSFSGLDPQEVSSDQNTFVVIDGNGFAPGLQVYFNGQQALGVEVLTGQRLIAVTPPLSPGTFDVTVALPNGDQATMTGSLTVLKLACPLPSPEQDTDGDGLTDCQERLGYEIRVDAVGFGTDPRYVGSYVATSNYMNIDTDSDGLTDREEFDNRSNPRLPDTDGDRLTDYEEVFRWLTSPISMDTDGDARGPNGDLPPNSSLFDGNELITIGFEEMNELYISEYIEGTAHNRALELFNPSSTAIDLQAGVYQFEIGPVGEEPITLALTGVVEPGQTFVVADEQADQTLLDLADLATALPFDGVTTQIRLTRAGTLIDALGGQFAFGPPVRDQYNHTVDDNLVADGQWQTFTAGATGPMHSLALLMNNTSLSLQVIQVAIQDSAGQELALTGAFLQPQFNGRVEMTFELYPFEVQAGQTYKILVQAVPAVDWHLSYADPYPGGQGSDGPASDFYFETYVNAAQPWGSGDTTTVDHTLRRDRGVCSGDSDLSDAANPVIEWVGLPADTFDGLGSHVSICPQRIVSGGTSPTLDDTDGDGKTDYEEFDDAVRSSRIAELPQAEVSIVGEMDIRLHVEYQESLGVEEQYGSSVAESSTHSLSTSSGVATTSTVAKSNVLAGEAEVSFPKALKLSVRKEVSTTKSFSTENSYSVSRDASKALQSESSRLQSESTTRTVASSSGALRLGLRLTNTGNLTYALTNLGVTVLQWLPNAHYDPETSLARGEFKTLATLTPSLADSFTLAPGESTPVIEVSAGDLSPDLVKEFLAKPTSLYFETNHFELENVDNINFAFFEETVSSRTALVVVDFGDGRVERYNVATNVDRLPDSTFAGVKLGVVMDQVFGSDYETTLNSASPPLSVLTRVRDKQTAAPGAPSGFWAVLGLEGVELHDDAGQELHFEDVVLHNRSSVYLVYTEDLDGDGLFAREEYTFGSSDLHPDTDFDDISDFEEVNVGWDVNAPTLPALSQYPRHVFADPVTEDGDGDGASDLAERLGADGIEPLANGDAGDATDPRNPDTDGDGLLDGEDPYPVAPARKLFVNQNAAVSGPGFSWSQAHKTLGPALALAASYNADSDPANDVAEIWVAAGVYRPQPESIDPREASFVLPANVGVYGGFTGNEAKRSQRNPNPYTNATVLSGDLLGDDSGAPGDIHPDHATRADNVYSVVTVPSGSAGIILDGFTVRSGNANTAAHPDGGGMRIAAPATLRNMLFVYNTAVGGGAGVLAAPGLTVEDSTFSSNVDAVGGAGLLVFGSALITGCSFSDNLVLDTAGPLYRGGAGLLAIDAELTVDRCQFQRNTVEGAFAGGGGVAMEGSGTAAVIRHSRFSNNSVHDSGGALTVRDGATAAVVNSAFWNNQSSSSAGGILALGGSTRVSLVNCTLMNNEAALEEGAGLAVEQGANASLVNSIVWGNTGATGSADQAAQVWSDSTAPYATHSCIQGGEWSPGVANISQDPQVADAIGGDLRLQAGSPCIDAANTLVDVDPFAAGFTALAPSDLGGRFRVTDGDGDGQEQVDMGAYEFQSAP